ncbi:MAG: ATP-dependent zinc metalloprotease FtsH [Alphaproteobacteria bacterium]|nr:ATP-dependent zinc metalloprotease FtsH [Alphaproteobacteria bacterium]
MNKISKSILFWLVLIGSISFFTLPFGQKIIPIESQELSFSTLVDYVNDGQVKTVFLPRSSSEISSKSYVVKVVLQNNKIYKSVIPENDHFFIERLLNHRVAIIVSYDSSMLQYIFYQLINLLPMLFIIGLMIYSVRQSKNGGNGGLGGGPFGFSKSKPKMFKPEDNKITFEDVAGIDEAKQDLEEIVDFLKSPVKFQRLGGKIPRGVLLVGDPGNGKTLLAKAIASEANVPFFSISGSDFVEVFVGVGASRVRKIFENAKKMSPCIVFIDEIDAVGKRRDMSLRGGNDEREQTLNQLLVEMDGFDENQGVIVIAATNRSDILDPALLRPGRFDRTINVPYPDMKGREMILKVHSRKVPLAPDVDLKTIARGTPGFSGAELANLINESALLAARQNKLAVYMKDLEMAKDKIIMGSERKTLHMDDKEKKLTAYHESGHAVMALLSPQYDPIHKVTIVPRGGALGMVVSLPENDKVSVSRTELLSNIKVAMGGRASEEIFFGEENVTTGASNDIEKATRIAKNMVLKWGMSDKLGFQAFFTSKYYNDASDSLSQRTSEIIDKEIEELVKRLYEEVRKTLIDNKDGLERIATKLLEKETLNGIEVQQLFDGTYIDAPEEETTNNGDPKLLDEFALGGLPNNTLPDNSKENKLENNSNNNDNNKENNSSENDVTNSSNNIEKNTIENINSSNNTEHDNISGNTSNDSSNDNNTQDNNIEQDKSNNTNIDDRKQEDNNTNIDETDNNKDKDTNNNK